MLEALFRRLLGLELLLLSLGLELEAVGSRGCGGKVELQGSGYRERMGILTGAGTS